MGSYQKRPRMEEKTATVDETELKRLKQIEKKKLQKELKAIEEEKEREIRKANALQSLKYLLKTSEKYSNFVKEICLDSAGSKKKDVAQEKNRLQPTALDLANEDIMDIIDTHETTNQAKDITTDLKYFQGTLHKYQIEGVNWLNTLHQQSVNCILADEMGLGKTVQAIAFLSYLYEDKITDPTLIVAPLSTVSNWAAEFKRFAPQLPVVIFYGLQDERKDLYQETKKKYSLSKKLVSPIIITAYHIIRLEEKFLRKFKWNFIIVDEGQAIKDHESQLALILRSFQSRNRLLLTGTPLQNNITELWSLLNFIMPHIFKSLETFEYLYLIRDMKDTNKLVEQEKNTKVLSTIHQILAPFMLRRLKADVLPDLVPKKEVLVYCPLSQIQKDMYESIIDRNIVMLLGMVEDKENVDNGVQGRPLRRCRKEPINYNFGRIADYEKTATTRANGSPLKRKLSDSTDKSDCNTQLITYLNLVKMTNIHMMFRKVVDHPYLVKFPMDPNSETPKLLLDDNLIKSSGKMMVLDAMLNKLKKRGHKVLIFSTLVMTLDLIEEYVLMRNYKYCRLDGAFKLSDRDRNISEFNNNPEIFLFIISTRAGGLGLNLMAADTVIFFDRDWNPQVDIQAQARCHRIGQTKPVAVYTLVTKNTIDEVIIERGVMKRRLEKAVLLPTQMFGMTNKSKSETHKLLLELKELLNSENTLQKTHSNGFVYTDKELDKLLDRSDMIKKMRDDKIQDSIKPKKKKK